MLGFVGCDEESSNLEEVQVAVPQTVSLNTFRGMVEVQNAMPIKESGKIYSYQDFIFINDNLEGVHVIDNSNPEAPVKKNFIKIPQNTDVAIKDDKLYANSAMDLVVFYISDLNNIEYLERIENVFEVYYPPMPDDAEYIDYININFNEEVIIGYEMKTVYRDKNHQDDIAVFDGAETGGVANGSDTGMGGSMARFKIVEEYLYTVTQTEIHVFDINVPSNPQEINSEYIGWDIETIFQQDDYLYLGSSSGMYIYSIENPTSPQYISQITHIMGCDPVVVQGDWAYVTIRGGNICGQNISQLEVIDVSDKSNPQRLNIYEMVEPYGLGIKGDHLFVCDGSEGLKVFDASSTPNLTQIDHFKNIETYDVIPLEETLLMVGGEVLYQYKYTSDGLQLISTFQLN